MTVLVVLGGAALALAAEEGGDATIESFGDASWWAVSTVTTVGYGDLFPVTPAGRAIAAFLMVTGIALFGVLTADLATFLLERAPDAPGGDDVGPKLTRCCVDSRPWMSA